MATLLSLLTPLMTLVWVGWLFAAVFMSDGQNSARSSTSASDDDADMPGSGLWDSRKLLARWETPLERDRYCRSRGNETNWAEKGVVNKPELFIAALVACLSAPSSGAADQLPSYAFASKATGTIELSVQHHSPLYAEFDRSTALSQRLTEALTNKGFVISQDKIAAKATLTFRGDIVLFGGPVYVKGAKVPIGDATEKALLAAREGGGVTQADVLQTAAGLVINKAGFDHAVTPFWRGLYLANMASAIGEATGVKGGFNKALTGDARGICLSRCDDWNKVNQAVYVWISLQAGESRTEIRVLTKAFSEIVAPDQVLDQALADGLNALKIVDLPASSAR